MFVRFEAAGLEIIKAVIYCTDRTGENMKTTGLYAKVTRFKYIYI